MSEHKDEGDAFRRQAEIDELHVWFLEDRLAHADRAGTRACSIPNCTNPAVKAVWLEKEGADDILLCAPHFDEVTRA